MAALERTRASLTAIGGWLLDHESRIFGVVLAGMGVDQWRTLIVRLDEYWVYLVNGIYGTPLLSLSVTALSALYMTFVALILLLARKPLARYETLMPNLLAVIAGFGIYCFGLLTPAETRPMGLYLPLTLLAAGVAIVLWSLSYLRRAFSVVPQARTVIRTGPYAYIRHPMYVGNILTITGLGLLLSTPVALVLSLVISALQVCRARYEDRLLSSTFVDYGAYMSQVNAFIPRLRGRQLVPMALLGLALTFGTADQRAEAQSKPAPAKTDPKLTVKCQEWHKKALAGQWFTIKEADEFAATDRYQEGLTSSSVCKEFFALTSKCQAPVIDVMSEDHGPGSKPSAAYLKANAALIKAIEETQGCKSIAGITEVCSAIKTHTNSGKSLTPKLQSTLRECADASIARTTSGLMRGAM